MNRRNSSAPRHKAQQDAAAEPIEPRPWRHCSHPQSCWGLQRLFLCLPGGGQQGEEASTRRGLQQGQHTKDDVSRPTANAHLRGGEQADRIKANLLIDLHSNGDSAFQKPEHKTVKLLLPIRGGTPTCTDRAMPVGRPFTCRRCPACGVSATRSSPQSRKAQTLV